MIQINNRYINLFQIENSTINIVSLLINTYMPFLNLNLKETHLQTINTIILVNKILLTLLSLSIQSGMTHALIWNIPY